MSTDPYQETGQESYSASERTWAMLCHLTALLGYIIPPAHIFVPLVLWFAKKDAYPLVRDQGKESVNFQLSITLYMILIGVFLGVAILLVPTLILRVPIEALAPQYVIGVIAVAALAVFGLVLLDVISVIVASMSANEGVPFRYPLRIRFIR